MPTLSVMTRVRAAYGSFRHPTTRASVHAPGGSLPYPPIGANQITGVPDFVGVGVMKAGTSRWYQLIVDHPGVADVAGRLKEVHFFDAFHSREPTSEERAAYARYFPRDVDRLVGEWTPRYLHDHWTPRLLAEVAPQTRVLVMLRDPISRYVSGVAHELNRKAQPGPTVANDHFARGLYHHQISRLRHWFPPEQILVLQYERCIEDAGAQLAATYDFLGLDPTHVPAGLDQRVNATWGLKPDLERSQVESLAAGYAQDLRQLAVDQPDLDLDLWPTWHVVQELGG